MNRLLLLGGIPFLALPGVAHHTPIEVMCENAPPPNPAREPKTQMRKRAAASMVPLKDAKPKPKAKSHTLKCLLGQKGRK